MKRAVPAIVLCLVFRALVALVVVAPWAAAAAQWVGHFPDGDAALFERGGVMFVETLRMMAPELGRLSRQSGALLLLASFAWLWPLGALIAALRPGGPERLSIQLGHSAVRFGRLALLLATVWLLRVAVAAAGIVGGGALARNLDIEPHSADVVRVGAILVGVVLFGVLSVVHDGGRVAIVQRGAGFWETLDQAIAPLRRSMLGTLWACGWRAVGALGLLFGSLRLSVVLSSGTPADRAVAVLVQLVALLGVVLLRATWLHWLTLRAHERRAG